MERSLFELPALPSSFAGARLCGRLVGIFSLEVMESADIQSIPSEPLPLLAAGGDVAVGVVVAAAGVGEL